MVTMLPFAFGTSIIGTVALSGPQPRAALSTPVRATAPAHYHCVSSRSRGAFIQAWALCALSAHAQCDGRRLWGNGAPLGMGSDNDAMAVPSHLVGDAHRLVLVAEEDQNRRYVGSPLKCYGPGHVNVLYTARAWRPWVPAVVASRGRQVRVGWASPSRGLARHRPAAPILAFTPEPGICARSTRSSSRRGGPEAATGS